MACCIGCCADRERVVAEPPPPIPTARHPWGFFFRFAEREPVILSAEGAKDLLLGAALGLEPDIIPRAGRGGPRWSTGPPSPEPRAPNSRPHHRHAIRLKRAIRCEDREPFVQRLHDEQAVERVAMVTWQVTQQVPVTHGRWKREKTIARDDVFNRVLQVQLAYGALDGDLPRADGAHYNEFGPLHRADGSGPKFLQVPPNQCVGVEQQPHSDSPVNKRNTSGGSGASKSSAIQPLPFPNPYLRKWRVSFGASGTRRALGLPDLAMMISRPCAACSTRSERWVFASYRLTCSRTPRVCLRRAMKRV